MQQVLRQLIKSNCCYCGFVFSSLIFSSGSYNFHANSAKISHNGLVMVATRRSLAALASAGSKGIPPAPTQIEQGPRSRKSRSTRKIITTDDEGLVSPIPCSTTRSSTEEESVLPTTIGSATPQKALKLEAITPSPAKKRRKTVSSPGSRSPPNGWENIYCLVQELRRDRTAPCDRSGCEALPDRLVDPHIFRFQVLISLMLSSQTKDAVVGEAVRSMQRDGVLNVPSIRAMSSEKLDQYIAKVGFHNNKTKFIKQVVEILHEKYDDDIPPTAADMMDLPGVGPKMAYICENVAWNKQTGIGVDTHMHRLFNELGWVKSTTPEHTRVEMEAWLPREKWSEVNLLWVGFGQELQQYKPKILRKALDCSRPAEALRLLKRCGLDYMKEGKKLGIEEEIRAVLHANKLDPPADHVISS